jgi:serine/threonine-protein kinase
MYYLARDQAGAMEQARFMVELDPGYYIGHWASGIVLMEAGNGPKAVAALRRAAELSGNAPLMFGWLGHTLARSGEMGEARALLEQLSGISRSAYVPPSCFAWIHLGLGDVDDAFQWMDRAIDARDPMMIPIKSYPFLDPLRPDPRYDALLRRMNLANA